MISLVGTNGISIPYRGQAGIGVVEAPLLSQQAAIESSDLNRSMHPSMTKDEKKRVAALIEAAECLFVENLALKLVMEYRAVPNWLARARRNPTDPVTIALDVFPLSD
jgi:hypothetical protein